MSSFVEMKELDAGKKSAGAGKISSLIGSRGQAAIEDAKAYVTEKRRVLIKAVFGEFLATFIFIFVVLSTSWNTVRNTADHSVSLLIGGISTGFCATAVIYAFADVSGAHFNPAVTFGTMVMGKTSWAKGLAYVAVQLLAATLATAFLPVCFPESGSTIFSQVTVNVSQDSHIFNDIFTEFILTFILVYVIFAVAFDTVDTTNAVKLDVPKVADPEAIEEGTGGQLIDRSVGRNLTIYTTSGSSKAGFAPLAIGFTLGFLCFIGGSTSGGAFNPARAFGPALLSGKWDSNYVYWVGDLCGAAAAGFVQSFVAHKPKQSSGANSLE